MRVPLQSGTVTAMLLALAACSTPRPGITLAPQPAPPVDQHLPAYVRRPPEPFSRANAIAMAEREWRAWGSVVNDDPPYPVAKATRPDQQPGLWQRVADYWWSSQDNGAPAGAWDSKYTPEGAEYDRTGPAWSAAFISYLMRTAGAGTGFPYSPLHADYINAAARTEGVLRAARPETDAPAPGDIICLGRADARNLRFDDLPTTRFFAHCDIVTRADPGQLTVIGGNVVGGVTAKHVPTTPRGTIATPEGRILDPRYPWFVILHVAYAE